MKEREVRIRDHSGTYSWRMPRKGSDDMLFHVLHSVEPRIESTGSSLEDLMLIGF